MTDSPPKQRLRVIFLPSKELPLCMDGKAPVFVACVGFCVIRPPSRLRSRSSARWLQRSGQGSERTSPTQVASLQFRGCKGETSFRVVDLHLKVPFCGEFHEFKEQPLVEVDSTCSPGTAS
ncbi:hypothetical protein TGDOM2_227015 [Toxoplasma gondii GAB2-2007-GAL-DOM2]|uniref:Uncharacterized protein n=5 Tax=Toxoplasma gondii TaxID=5811 RepID=S7UWX4_TOXGG|nr:hypothetical protein TGGT1_227015 [Toxoplasma gondii GT1]KFG45175.1 hypothetical protein TGDOM2_227015 [Toxoplasma gondii GAB2-2007-GAL-DOM2]KFG51935.1 hypothetical protein TGFOU_227015 [Toxoplasma gondii FOU]PUA91061.1 hypothetical protein TGBR9_227015 [Toxoplasma gondii TgCATBr9]RQX74426.1 hypothetical protein TGCAST_227015 [Toxoplasma gondii CAST]